MSNNITSVGYLRLNQIVGNPKANPPIPAIIPVSKSTWWNGVKAGRFTQPVKIGERSTACRVEGIHAFMDSVNVEVMH